MVGHEIAVDEVRAQLRRVLASLQFSDSEDARELLRLLVEKTVCGEQDMLSDPALLSVAREVRLRDRLARYYSIAGKRDAVLIHLKENDLVPYFRYRTAQPQTTAHSQWWMFGSVALLSLLGIAWWKQPTPKLLSNGPVLRRITSTVGLNAYPSFSRDGKLLVYASNRSGGGNLDIWVQPMDGGEAHRITRDPADDREPSFSPDGRSVVFRSERDGGGIYLVPVEGGEDRLLVQHGRNPLFSPDGHWILYWLRDENFHPGTAWVIPAAGGEPTQIRADFEDTHTPTWSPDGKHILFCGTKVSNTPGQDHDWWVMPFPNGTPEKTGAFAALDIPRRTGLLQSSLDAVTWHRDFVLFTLRNGDSVNVFRARIKPGPWTVVGPAERLTFGAGFEVHPGIAGDLLSFASGTMQAGIYGIAVDAEAGTVQGELVRYSETDSAWEHYPSIAENGSMFAFVSNRGESEDRIWLHDLDRGSEVVLTQKGPLSRSRMSRDGQEIAYRKMAADRKSQSILSIAAKPGAVPNEICADCGSPLSWSRDRKWLLFETGKRNATIGVLDTKLGPGLRYESRPQSEILVHPEGGVHAARFSPDDRWIVFHLDLPEGRKQIFAAPFTGEQLIREAEFRPLTDGTATDQVPALSPRGNVLYFLSNREGPRCIWARRIDPKSMRPIGEPFPVLHFHSAGRSLFTTTAERPEGVGLSISNGLLVFSLDGVTSNVWTTPITD